MLGYTRRILRHLDRRPPDRPSDHRSQLPADRPTDHAIVRPACSPSRATVRLLDRTSNPPTHAPTPLLARPLGRSTGRQTGRPTTPNPARWTESLARRVVRPMSCAGHRSLVDCRSYGCHRTLSQAAILDRLSACLLHSLDLRSVGSWQALALSPGTLLAGFVQAYGRPLSRLLADFWKAHGWIFVGFWQALGSPGHGLCRFLSGFWQAPCKSLARCWRVAHS